jgi:hypothetical protein
MTVYQFSRRRTRANQGIAGLFWLKSPAEQHARVRELSRSRLSPETIATVTRLTLREVMSIIEVAQ